MYFLFGLLALASVGFAADDTTKLRIVQPISELKLTNGTVFRNVTIIRYEKEKVVLKSSSGLGPLPYSYIPEPLRAQMKAERDTEAAARAKTEAAAAAAKADALNKPVVHKGEIFVVTRGRVNVKLGASSVTVYPLDEARNALKFKTAMPEPLVSTTTDSEGRFAFSLNGNRLPALIHVVESRRAGTVWETYVWDVATDSFGDPSTIILSNANMTASDSF